MTETTPRLRLPFILPGQAQKELFHNEALARIDAALHASVEGEALSQPPGSPTEGQSWIVGAAASAAWAGQENKLASWTSGGWRFVEPIPGFSVWNREAGYWIYWSGTAWSAGEHPATSLIVKGKKVVGERQLAIPSPSGGTIIDEEARTTIATIIATLKSHGLTD
jgi:hypothetical protein